MSKLLYEKIVKARGTYYCDAARFMFEAIYNNDAQVTAEDFEVFMKHKNNNFVIKRGSHYLLQKLVNDCHKFYEFRAIPEIHDMCIKYGFYNEEK